MEITYPVSQLFASGGQSIGASVFPMNCQSWFPLVLTGLISLLSKGPSRVFSSPTISKHQFLGSQPSLWSNSHIHTWLLEKPQLWLYGLLLTKHNFSSKEQASFNFVAAVTIHSDFGAQEYKICHCFHFLPTYLPWSDGIICHDLNFLNASLFTLFFHPHQEVL